MSEAAAIININRHFDLISSFEEFCSVQNTTLKGYAVGLRAFGNWTQAAGIMNPTRQDIRDYVRYLDGSGLKPGTRQQYFRVVKQLYKWAATEGLCPDITAGIKGIWKQDRQHHKKDALGREDVQAVAATIDRSTEQGKNRILSALSYLSILWILPRFLCKDDAFARFHARQGLVLFVFSIICDAISAVFPIGGLLHLFRFYCIYKGMTNALNDRMEPLPYIGQFGEKDV